MPHFIIDCSQDIVEHVSPQRIMDVVYELADASGLFAPNDIKVRIQPFQFSRLGDGKKNFLHIFAYIMEGRTDAQKAALARTIIEGLAPLFPAVSFLSIHIDEFRMATYCNKAMTDPANTTNDRHFSR